MFEASFESLDTGTEERTSLYCRNVFEWLWGRSDTSWMDHHQGWVMGFQIWSIYKASVNAVKEERRITAQKRARMTRLLQKLVLILFFDDCGTATVEWVSYQEKCICCFLYQNALEIENLYPKEEDLFMLHHDNTTSHWAGSMQKLLEKNKIWLIPHPPYSSDLASCDFFIFPKLKLVMKG